MRFSVDRLMHFNLQRIFTIYGRINGLDGRKDLVAAFAPGKKLGFFGLGVQALFTIATRH